MRRIFRNLIARDNSIRHSTIRRFAKTNRSRLSLLHMEDRVVPALIPVTSLADAGPGTFRDAVAIANSGVGLGVGDDTIEFQIAGTVVLATGQIVVTEDVITPASKVSITKNVVGSVTIDGANLSGILAVDVGYTATAFNISDITLTKGKTGGDGGGLIVNSATALATLTNVSVTNCEANTLAGGGIAVAAGGATLVNCTVTGNKVVAAVNVYGGGVFANGGPLTITNCTITGNTADAGVAPFGYGGNVFSNHNVTITGSNLSNGVTDADGSGGGIAVTGATSVVQITNTTISGCSQGIAAVYIVAGASCTISGCTISNNTSPSAAGGLAFLGTGASVISVTNTVVNNNSSGVGGAMYVNGGALGSLTFTGCTFNNNSCGNVGGVVTSNSGTSSMSFIDCSFNGNLAVGGGVLYTFGPANGNVTFTRCTADANVASGGNGGGVITLSGSWNSTLTLEDSTFSNNKAAGNSGGVLFMTTTTTTPTVVISNTTMVGNSTIGNGGALRITGATPTGWAGTFTIRNSTLDGNTASGTGGAIALTTATGTLSIVSSVIAENRATAAKVLNSNNSDFFQSTAAGTTMDFTFLGVVPPTNPPTEPVPLNNLKGTPAVPLLPGLLALGNYGGPTKTMVPSPTSPVIGKGDNPLPALTNDQRGAGFPRAFGGTVDMGAAESFNPNPFVVSVVAAKISAATPGPHTFDITFSDSQTLMNLTSFQTVGAVTVSGGGYGAGVNATWVSTDNTNPSAPVVKYSIPDPNAPAGFDLADNGKYNINIVANKIFDTDPPTGPNAVAAGTYGSFIVGLPQTFTVNAINDEITDTDGKTSLREAINAANAAFGNDSIVFDEALVFNVPQTITLTKGELSITQSVNIDGPTAACTVDANLLSRVMIITSTSAESVTISDLTLTKGLKAGNFAGFDGAGIATSEDLTLNNVTVTGNKTDLFGGGISATGGANLTINNSTISGNSAGNTINFSGGGILVNGGSLTVNKSNITGNASVGGGAGIAVYSASVINVTDSTISGNTAAGEVGGAMYLFPGVNLTVSRSTLNANSAPAAGGAIAIFNPAGMLISNSTISGNTTLGEGGGVYTNGLAVAALIQNSTIYQNAATGTLLGGGGIAMNANAVGGALTLQSTIVAENIDNGATAAPDVASTIAATPVAGNNNLIGVADFGNITYTGVGNVTGTGALPQLANLDPLALNSAPAGTPFTHALKAGSAAKNAGNNLALLGTDERGGTFLRVQFGQADIGAFEEQPLAAPPTVMTVVPNGGGSQRSNVFSIVITFSESVTFSGPTVNAFTLTRANAPLSATEQPGVNGKVNIVATPAAGPTNTITLTFATSGAEPVFGVSNVFPTPPNSFTGYSLPDGTFNLAIDGTQITGVGGNMASYSQTGSSGSGDKLFRLFGDLNGDGAVSNSDFNAFKVAFAGGVNVAFDYNNDGDVANNDFNQLKTRFGSSMP